MSPTRASGFGRGSPYSTDFEDLIVGSRPPAALAQDFELGASFGSARFGFVFGLDFEGFVDFGHALGR